MNLNFVLNITYRNLLNFIYFCNNYFNIIYYLYNLKKKNGDWGLGKKMDIGRNHGGISNF